jgi:hypothetical protein
MRVASGVRGSMLLRAFSALAARGVEMPRGLLAFAAPWLLRAFSALALRGVECRWVRRSPPWRLCAFSALAASRR